MATYPPRRLLGARPLPSDPRRDPRRSDFPGGGGGSPRNLRCLFTHFQGPAARHHQLLRIPSPHVSWSDCLRCHQDRLKLRWLWGKLKESEVSASQKNNCHSK
ncbi:uncharacterized protein AAG666_022636 isoform 2-T2 [Megaptera novaeangliae]